MFVRAMFLIAAMIGCGTMAAHAQQKPQQFTSPVKPGEQEKKFPVKQNWVLKEYNGKPVPVAGDFTLTIDETFRGSGTTSCNGWSATMYPVRGQRLGVGPIALTRNECDAAKTRFENVYLSAIHAAPFWDLEKGDLVLKGPGGVLRFSSSI